jgi:hypothetical protein
MKRIVLVVSLLCSFGGSGSAAGKDLYVDLATGNDSVSYQNNTAGQPWRTIGRAAWGSGTIAAPSATQAARAGDRVIVAPGSYETDATTNSRYTPIYNPVNSGSAGNPIIFMAQQPGTVTLQSTLSNGSQPIIGALNNAYIEWHGFVIDERDIPTRPDTGPVVVWNSHHVTLESLVIRGYNRGWVDNHNGIRLEHAHDVIVRNNHVSNFLESQNNHNSNGLTIYDGARILIENNEFASSNAGIHVKCCNPGPITIRYNLIRDTGRALLFSGVEQATAYSNIIVNAGAGITFSEYDPTQGVERVTVANNTIVDATGSGDGAGQVLRYGTELHRDVRVYNNAFSRSRICAMSYEDALTAQYRSAYNAYHDCTVAFAQIAGNRFTWSEWNNRFGQDTAGSRVIGDPGFRDRQAGDYFPTASSVLNGAGLDVLDLDQDGSTTDSVNIGAYALGTEVIGRRSQVAPSPPSNLRVE